MLAKYPEEQNGSKVLAFAVDRQYIAQPSLHECPVFPFEQIESCCAINEVEFIIGIGHKSMNSVREAIFNRLKSKKYTIGCFIHPDATVGNLKLGSACWGQAHA